MQPYLEILFSLFLITQGVLMIQKRSALKFEKKNAHKKSYAQEKYRMVLSRRISFRFMVLLFTLAGVIMISICIEKGLMYVTW